MYEEFGVGSRVADKVSLIHGTVVSRTVHLYADVEVGILRDGVDNDGRMWDVIWLPEGRCTAFFDTR